MNKVEIPKAINLDGHEIMTEDLSDQARRLIEIHTLWRSQQAESNAEVLKVNLAIKSIENEIAELLYSELGLNRPEQVLSGGNANGTN